MKEGEVRRMPYTSTHSMKEADAERIQVTSVWGRLPSGLLITLETSEREVKYQLFPFFNFSNKNHRVTHICSLLGKVSRWLARQTPWKDDLIPKLSYNYVQNYIKLQRVNMNNDPSISLYSPWCLAVPCHNKAPAKYVLIFDGWRWTQSLLWLWLTWVFCSKIFI